MIFKSLKTKDILIFAAFIILFVATSFFSHQYSQDIKNLVSDESLLGILVYVAFSAMAEVIGPITSLPLLPLVVTIWGSVVAAVLSIAGWTLGATIAFWVCRKYGKPIAAKFINIQRAEEISRAIPEKNLFWFVVLIRMIFPVDVLSYALGLFTNIKWHHYVLATIIGISPFTFILAYGIQLPLRYQIYAAMLILFVTFVLYNKVRHKIMGWFKNNKIH